MTEQLSTTTIDAGTSSIKNAGIHQHCKATILQQKLILENQRQKYRKHQKFFNEGIKILSVILQIITFQVLTSQSLCSA